MSIMSPQYPPNTVMEPVDAFATDLDGRTIVMVPGRDRVTADHELVRRHPQQFRPVDSSEGGVLSYRTEAATDNPGEQRGRQRRQPPTSKPEQEES